MKEGSELFRDWGESLTHMSLLSKIKINGINVLLGLALILKIINVHDNSIFGIYTFFWWIFIYDMLDLELGFERYESFKKYLIFWRKREGVGIKPTTSSAVGQGTNQCAACMVIVYEGISSNWAMPTAHETKYKKPNVFLTYRWHWWVILYNSMGSFNDGRPEALFALLLRDIY